MTTYEQAKDTLLALAESTRGFDGNEATTRLRLIDAVLKDVLGWSPDEIACEEHVDGEYLDYVLGNPERRAVVEAKRTARTFDVPAGVESGLLDLATVRTYNISNEKAVDQVLDYCQTSGIGPAILANGHQFLGFLGSRSDGRKPTDGKAIYYNSLDDIYNDFPRFWDYFSRDGLIRGDLTRVLQLGSTAPPPPAPLSSRIHEYPGFRVGSDMETDLRILGDLFIQDIVREESITDEFLTECYCSSGALSQYAVVSKEILRSRYTVLSQQANIESAREKEGPNPHIKDDLIASAIVKRPIVLLGDVGVGKSIFLKHLFRVDATDLLDKTIIFYVDFLQHSGLVDDVPQHIVSSITETLRSSLNIETTDRNFVRSVYNREINTFKRGIFGTLEQEDPPEYRRREIDMLSEHVSDGYEHARRSLRFLQGSRGINFVIALDNVDQHLPGFQEQIFIAGQSLADTWPVAVFMSLRPDTFHASRRSGALAAYQPRVFTVSPPRSDLVILKRLRFARKQLVEFGRLPGFPEGLTLDSDSLLVYIDVLLKAFETNDDLIQLVDNLSSGNTRRALDFISTFVGSGYVQTERILRAHRDGQQYIIPIHEFTRAILYGDYRYYDPSTSPVPNLFSISKSDGKEHFLSPMLLAAIQAMGEREAEGFVEVTHVYELLQRLGYDGHQIEAHLSAASERQLIELTDHSDTGRLARISPAGGYLHKVLIVDFAYVDAVVVDTPILDPAIRSEIHDVHDINQRRERAEIFIRYLSACWPYGNDELPFSWPRMRRLWNSNAMRVRRGAERAAARRVRDP
ncbi:hypothetical protein [Mycobacterium sp. 1465703.0]|uniref:hypothetical protein n=1 Tax=Mycobacterium sp. 1465703.0 TaxID=1834078 RepID=UPI0012E9CD13|nr:hypothetical protein [Mycobacterium sp. 1465703.0]